MLSELYNLRDDIAETDNVYDRHPKLVAEIEAVAEEFRRVFGDQRLNCVGTDIREVGLCNNPKPLTEFDENHPYMIAYYDLADMPTMVG